MNELKFNATIPRYLFGKAFRGISQPALWSGLSCLYPSQAPIPEVPGSDWVRVRTIYGGICGSDLSAIYLDLSPYYSALASFPHTPGHENVGLIDQIGENVTDFYPGDRVVVEPALWCMPRGFTDLCSFCLRGEINRCERITEGNLSAGLAIGSCRDTGGSWSPYFLAHMSQLYRVPVEISDENALLIEPFAVGLHAALMALPSPGSRILIIGGGCIGLCTLATLRAIGCQEDITFMARYEFQSQAALKLGADRVISMRGTDYLNDVSEIYQAKLIKPVLGKRVMIGGPDIIFECTGNEKAIDDAIRIARNGARVYLVGVPVIPKKVDWTAIFIQELWVQASYIYHHAEVYEDRRWKTFELAIDLMQQGKVDLGWMVTHRFGIHEYKKALKLIHKRAESNVIKAVFNFRDSDSMINIS